jgi:hypothetical protein
MFKRWFLVMTFISLLLSGACAASSSQIATATPESTHEISPQPRTTRQFKRTKRPTPNWTETEVAKATLDAEYAQASLFNYRVVYLVDAKAVQDSPILNVENIQNLLGALPAGSWDELLELNHEKPIDALFIHSSALDWVDVAWTSQAYNEGVIFLFTDLQYGRAATILGIEDKLGPADDVPISDQEVLFQYWYECGLETSGYFAGISLDPNYVAEGPIPYPLEYNYFAETLKGSIFGSRNNRQRCEE